MDRYLGAKEPPEVHLRRAVAHFSEALSLRPSAAGLRLLQAVALSELAQVDALLEAAWAESCARAELDLLFASTRPFSPDFLAPLATWSHRFSRTARFAHLDAGEAADSKAAMADRATRTLRRAVDAGYLLDFLDEAKDWL